MSFNPLTEKGLPLERQLRSWSELTLGPYNTRDVHPYTRCRVILMNGVEVEAQFNSHMTARRIDNDLLKKQLAVVRRVEQQQQKAINWLIPGDESVLANTIGYEQVAVDLTAWCARHEPDPYLKMVYDFGLLEDFDHLYRYANLMDMLGEGRQAEEITGDLTELLPGRPTIFQHRHPQDELRRPMTIAAADPQSILNAMTVLAAEQQTMNYYMTVGNRPEQPLARSLYMEIAQIEEQHVTHYESILDPTTTWLENLVLHEYHECWAYWSCLETETDPRIKQLWDVHLAMELEHLRLAVDAMQKIDGRDVAQLLPQQGFSTAMTFEPNKQYVREVLERTVDYTASGFDFVPVEELPHEHRWFSYQSAVNKGGAPSEEVIEQMRSQGGERRSATDGPHPVQALRADGRSHATGYAKAVQAAQVGNADGRRPA